MATIPSKCKLNAKSIKDKYSALKEVEDKKTFAAKYVIRKNILHTWITNKDKIFEATKKGSNSKCQRLKEGYFCKLGSSNT